VIRDILQFANDADEAVEIAKNAVRTWPVWLGIGDGKKFRPMLYNSAELLELDENSLSEITGMPHFDDMAYIDMHGQPSKHTDLPAIIQDYYGKITPESLASEFIPKYGSADVHAAVYDFTKKQSYIAHGIVDD
jgi:hypothetical protein